MMWKLFKKTWLAAGGKALKADVVGRRGTVSTGSQGAYDSSPATRHPPLPNRFAVLGDIHANLEALSAVLADIKKQGVLQVVCTGDVVGYGANPSECLNIIRDLNCPVVIGNHDAYAAGNDNLGDFNLNAMNAILWTRKRLSDEEKMWLRNLPIQIALGTEAGANEKECTSELETTIIDLGPQGESVKLESATCRVYPASGGTTPDSRHLTLVHSSLSDPKAWHYIMKPEKAEVELRNQKRNIIFFGHTHLPSIFSFHPQTEEFVSSFPAEEGCHHLEAGWKHLVNPGSVGQPRDHDPRASYALYDLMTGTFEIRRVAYDISLAQKKIEAAGLPLRNAERLSQGR